MKIGKTDRWDSEYDVVVVGSGTGQFAAIRLADAGLKCLVIEKLVTVGGTTALSGGGIWAPNNYLMEREEVEDSQAAAVEYFEHATFGQSESELMRAYVRNCNGMVAYTRELGVDWQILPGGAFQDYYEELPGARTYGRTLLPIFPGEGRGGGHSFVQFLHKTALEKGVEYRTKTTAKRLITDDDDRVVGVLLVGADGKDVRVRARRAVLMASGGFSRNETMVKHFLRAPIYYPHPPEGDTGDGHRMGMELGADLRNMNEVWGWPVFWDPDTKTPIFAIATELGMPGCIVVNKKGERFFNEAAPYARVIRAFQHYDPATLTYPNVPGFAIIDANFRMNYPFAHYTPDMDLPKWVSQAHTLDELAEKLGVDRQGLADTVKRFNEYAQSGVDLEWHRGETAFDKQTAADSSRGLPNSSMAAIAEPPFAGVAIWPGVLGTNGGLRINENAQVMHVLGHPIDGLYAMGNCTGAVCGAGYVGGGVTIGSALTFGFIAANHITDVAARNHAAP
jgi:succinate dehydrogenase/fumarate reductase flavoprotein subunit